MPEPAGPSGRAQPRPGLVRRRALLGALGLPLLALAGCGGERRAQPAPDTPPEIVSGTTPCEGCAGPITDLRFAAAVVASATAEPVFFDDPGTMIAYVQGQGRLNGRGWVHDYGTGAWIDAQKAVYVADSRVTTPAGTGVVAFANKADANALAKQGGVVQTWAQMLDHWRRGKQP